MSNSFPEQDLLEEAIKSMKEHPSDENVEHLITALVCAMDCKKAFYGAWKSDAVEMHIYGGRCEAQAIDMSRIPVVRLRSGEAFLQIATRQKFLQLGDKDPMTAVNLPLATAIDLVKEHDEIKGIVFNANSLRPMPVTMDILLEAKERSSFAGRNALEDFM